MSKVSISYKNLQNSAQGAVKVATKMEDYASSLGSVYKKLNQYSGECTENIASAKTNIKNKISEVEKDSKVFHSYGSNLLNLHDNCVETDEKVAKKVAGLTGEFRKEYKIPKEGPIQMIRNFLTVELNKSAFGRWIGEKLSDFSAWKKGLKDSIKEWFHYKGGKQLLKGRAIALLKIAAAVALVVATITTGGGALVVIAGVVGGIISALNGVVDFYNEWKAYSMQSRGDAATAKRRRKLNSLQDVFRSSFIYGEDGETYKKGGGWKAAANVLDVTEILCMGVSLVKGAGSLAKNGYKWATGNTRKIKDISLLRDVFKKEIFNQAAGKLKLNISDAWKAAKGKDWQKIKKWGKLILKDVGKNLKSEYWDFEEKKKVAKTSKNLIGLGQDITEGLVGDKAWGKVAFNKVLKPAIPIFAVKDENVRKTITIEDPIGIYDKAKKMGNKFLVVGRETGVLKSEKLTFKVQVNERRMGFSQPNGGGAW